MSSCVGVIAWLANVVEDLSNKDLSSKFNDTKRANLNENPI